MSSSNDKGNNSKENISFHDRLSNIYFLVISFGIIVFLIYVMFKVINLGNFSKGERWILRISDIALGIIGAIVGVLVPLHYRITMDLIRDLDNHSETQKEWIKAYASTSDIVIYVTACFGVSVFIRGGLGLVCSKSELFDISFWVVLLFAIISIAGIIRSILLVGKNAPKPQWFSYIVSIVFLILITIIWSFILASAPNSVSLLILSVIVLSAFYIIWLSLKVPFIPITRKMKIKKDKSSCKDKDKKDGNKDRKNGDRKDGDLDKNKEQRGEGDEDKNKKED